MNFLASFAKKYFDAFRSQGFKNSKIKLNYFNIFVKSTVPTLLVSFSSFQNRETRGGNETRGDGNSGLKTSETMDLLLPHLYNELESG